MVTVQMFSFFSISCEQVCIINSDVKSSEGFKSGTRVEKRRRESSRKPERERNKRNRDMKWMYSKGSFEPKTSAIFCIFLVELKLSLCFNFLF